MKAIISETANNKLIEYIEGLGLPVEKVPNHNGSPIGTHADLYYCQLHAGNGSNNVFTGDRNLVGMAYPEDCIYNAACTGKHFIHNTNITHPDLLAAARSSGMDIIHVKQGYAKCSCVLVDEDSIITSDAGIAKACKDKLDCLLISPGNILLEGFEYGFPGGCSGRIDDEIIFNGNLAAHPNCREITGFIRSRGLRVKYFSDYPLTDIGSIIYCTDQ